MNDRSQSVPEEWCSPLHGPPGPPGPARCRSDFLQRCWASDDVECFTCRWGAVAYRADFERAPLQPCCANCGGGGVRTVPRTPALDARFAAQEVMGE